MFFYNGDPWGQALFSVYSISASRDGTSMARGNRKQAISYIEDNYRLMAVLAVSTATQECVEMHLPERCF